MSAFGNTVMGWVERHVSALATTRYGFVTSYNPEDHTARVQFADTGTDAGGFLPILNIAATDTMTFRVGLSIGAHVILIPVGADGDAYQVLGSVHNEAMPPPVSAKTIDGDDAPVASTEWLVKNAGGAVLRFNEDGSIFVQSPSEIRMQAPHFATKGEWDHDGSFKATGNVESEADVKDHHGTLDGLRGHYNGHKHSGVQTGSGQSAGPTPTD